MYMWKQIEHPLVINMQKVHGTCDEVVQQQWPQHQELANLSKLHTLPNDDWNKVFQHNIMTSTKDVLL